MTTFDERRTALRLGREWLEALACTDQADHHADQGHQPSPKDAADRVLQGYPTDDAIEAQLAPLQGQALLRAVRQIERARALMDRVANGGDSPGARSARHIGRHFPERDDFHGGVRSPVHARYWAAWHLNRPPGRDALLSVVRAPAIQNIRPSRHRREALRRMQRLLVRLQRDPVLPPFAFAEVMHLLRTWPTKALLSRRFEGVDLAALKVHLDTIQRGCFLFEAVIDGTFPAGRRQRALLVGWSRHAPAGEAFPLLVTGRTVWQEWVDWLFERRGSR